jgi:hypothetical protein
MRGCPKLKRRLLPTHCAKPKGESDLVTRKDLQIELAPIKADIVRIKWMLGLLLGGVAALVLKAFF